MLFRHRDPAARKRQQLAAGLNRLLAGSASDSSISSAVPVSYHSLATCRHKLHAVADQLAGPDPIADDGLKRVDELLTDPGSPLYTGGPAELADAVDAAHRALLVEAQDRKCIR